MEAHELITLALAAASTTETNLTNVADASSTSVTDPSDSKRTLVGLCGTAGSNVGHLTLSLDSSPVARLDLGTLHKAVGFLELELPLKGRQLTVAAVASSGTDAVRVTLAFKRG